MIKHHTVRYKDSLSLCFYRICQTLLLLLMAGQVSYTQDLRVSSTQMYREAMSLEFPESIELIKAAERKYHNSKSYLLKSDEPITISIQFINASGHSVDEFARIEEIHLSNLNQAFTMEGQALSQYDGYEHLLDTANISFDIERSIGIDIPIIWEDWNTWTPELVQSDAIKIWVINTPNDVGSYADHILGEEPLGIVLDVDAFNNLDNSALIIMMGEYLGLSSLYDESGMCRDDKVRDTPRHNSKCTSCIPTYIKSSCDNKTYMCGNFMSLAPDHCKSFFTKGQVRRMHFMLTLSQLK